MRLVDMLFSQAEHDDYHLARISELKKLLAKTKTGTSGAKLNAQSNPRSDDSYLSGGQH